MNRWNPAYQRGFDAGVAEQVSVHGYALDDVMEQLARAEAANAALKAASTARAQTAALEATSGASAGATGAIGLGLGSVAVAVPGAAMAVPPLALILLGGAAVVALWSIFD